MLIWNLLTATGLLAVLCVCVSVPVFLRRKRARR